MDTKNHDGPLNNAPKSMYNRTLLIVIVSLLLVIIWLLVHPPGPPLPSPPNNVRPQPPAGPEKVRTTVGTVVAYKYNPHLDVNAVQIKTQSSGLVTIDFRPHTAAAVMKTGPVGQRVKFTYSRHPDDEVIGYQLMRMENEATGLSQDLRELPPPPDIPNHHTQNFKLDEPLLITDVYGGIVALRKGNELFHFKPGLVDDIAPLMKSSRHFELMAVRRNDDLGFVNVNHDKVYIVLNITMDNKTFLVR